LEDRLDEIEDRILDNIIPSFTSDYEGEGWEWDHGSDFKSLDERIREKKETEGDGKSFEDSGDKHSEETDIEVKAEIGNNDVLLLDEFIEKYKEAHGLDSLDEKTLDRLEKQYNEVVDKPPSPDRSSRTVSNFLNPGYSNPSNNLPPSGSFNQSVVNAAMAAEEAQTLSDPFHGIDFAMNEPVLGLNSQEQQKLEETQQQLRDIKIEIKTLEQRKSRLEREIFRLQPEDLLPTLTANVATIILSVVIPVFAYLLFEIDTRITVPSWAWIISYTEINVFLSWLLGLFVVFESIHARMNDREPRTYSLYKQVGSHLFRK
jgi:hypothetical protein